MNKKDKANKKKEAKDSGKILLSNSKFYFYNWLIYFAENKTEGRKIAFEEPGAEPTGKASFRDKMNSGIELIKTKQKAYRKPMIAGIQFMSLYGLPILFMIFSFFFFAIGMNK